MGRAPYEKAWDRYADLGWSVLPVEGKSGIPTGVTGREGVLTREQMERWATTFGQRRNIAVRADGWISIDVDVYDGKRGDVAIEELAAQLGPLPPTFTSTARGQDSRSRQHFYSVPTGVELVTKIGDAVEIVQRHHRYSVVWPSKHPKSGETYTWYSPHGEPMKSPPAMYDLPPLPEAWLEHLSHEPAKPLLTGVEVIPWRALVESFDQGESCYYTHQLAIEIDDTRRRVGHLGHDETKTLAFRGMMLGREGHRGVPAELARLYEMHEAYLASVPGRRTREAEALFRDMADTAQRKVPGDACDCPLPGVNELRDEDLDGDAAEREVIRTLFAEPLTNGRGRLNGVTAMRQFSYEHPVKRYQGRGSGGATVVWTGDRWELADLTHHCRIWLDERIGNESTKAMVSELAWRVADSAEVISDDDVDHRFISVANGLLNWRTEELIPHTREVFTFYHLPWSWNPAAKPGRWAEWLSSTIDVAQRPFVEEVLGYAISPAHDLKCALALTGPGGGGKSTLINVISSLVGKANTSALAPNALTERFSKVTLHGKLVNAAGDVGAEMMRNVGTLKSIIAADAITAEYKGQDAFTFRPNVFILASFNSLPASESNDSGFWDRWMALRFTRRFNAEGSSNNYFRDEMPRNRAIMEGVLVVAVRALQRLRERGSFDTSAFIEAKNSWREETDPVAAFVGNHLVPAIAGRVNGAALYQRYRRQAEEDGHKPRGRNTFNQELERYLNETIPLPGTMSHKTIDRATRAVYWEGVKVVHEPVANPFELGGQDPNALYGPNGWTLRATL